jgi:hypothetical protein
LPNEISHLAPGNTSGAAALTAAPDATCVDQ